MSVGELEVDGTGDVLPVETRVGEFRIRGLLGEGAMGQVYLAQDTTLGRRVALKVIKRSMMQAGGLERFLEEARATASFSHPNIVTLHGVGEHEGRPFLALEHVDGESLRARIAAGPLPVREALRVGRAIAEAMAEAHRRGLVHADLKPENVVIQRDGRVRVVDFGLARLVGAAVDTASGTPAYMAPERWRGQTPSGAIDVWAFGILLHELIAGVLPIADAVLMRLTYAMGAGAAPYAANGAAWSALVADCLAIEPAARPTADQLVRRLSVLIDPRAAVDDEARCPFPGLAAFSRDDAAGYFGRRGELDAIIEQLRTHPLIPIVGPSGVGKSSFVYAALIPRLSDTGPWSVCALRPGSSPFASLATALCDGPAEDPAEALRRHPETLSLTLGRIAARRRGRVLVFLDQFEETFTLAGPEAIAFCDCLARAALPDEPWRLVLTVRDDFFGGLAESPAMRALLGAVMPLAPLSTTDLRAAVLGPLANAGYVPDAPDLADRIVSDVEHQPACLPLLQFTCRSLWDRRDVAARQILTAEYEAMGRASGALAAHAQHLMAQLSAAQVRLVRKLLLGLLHPDGTRRPRRRAELLDGLPGEAADIVDRLLEHRLLVASRETEADEARLEVAHEALASTWPQLARWLDETYEERLLLAELEQASQRWQRRGQRVDETWAGPALGEALRKVSAWNITLPGTARAFLQAGQERERRAQRRRRWLIGGTIAVLGAAAILAALVALMFARKQAQIDLAGADMGAFTLELEPFDWDAKLQQAQPPKAHPPLTWALHFVDPKDPHAPGKRYLEPEDLRRGTATWQAGVLVERVEARSGSAFIEVSGRGGDCAPSLIHLQHLPGYIERGTPSMFRLPIPTCSASREDTIEIAEGTFVRNVDLAAGGVSDDTISVPRYAIDRTEVTRGAFARYGDMEAMTGDGAALVRHLPSNGSDQDRFPVVGVNFFTARNYCHYLGKELPTVDQWQKAFRGGLVVGAAPNPAPARARPWLHATRARPANIAYAHHPAALATTGAHPDDTSPYGVVDLAGNVSEWSLSPAVPLALRGLRTVLGANWDSPPSLGHDQIFWRNSRPDRYLDFVIGVRCVSNESQAAPTRPF